AIWALLLGSAPILSNGSPLRDRKAAMPSGVSRTAIASILTPLRRNSASTGASATHGTHQLAKTFSSLGSPLARSADFNSGLVGSAAASWKAGTGLLTN